MATITKFEDLEIWQLSRNLNKSINPLLKKPDTSRNFKLKNQLDSSAGSVMGNIAEGFERDGNSELIQFLAISKSSLGEVRSQLYRKFDRELISDKDLEILQGDCLTLGKTIHP